MLRLAGRKSHCHHGSIGTAEKEVLSDPHRRGSSRVSSLRIERVCCFKFLSIATCPLLLALPQWDTKPAHLSQRWCQRSLSKSGSAVGLGDSTRSFQKMRGAALLKLRMSLPLAGVYARCHGSTLMKPPIAWRLNLSRFGGVYLTCRKCWHFARSPKFEYGG